MTRRKASKLLTILISLVWLINGLLCKVLNLVPRHQEIVANILSAEHSRSLTAIIGMLEIAMGIWILTGYRSKLNAITQVVIVASMNLLEFLLVPDLLLWGKVNSLFALMFILLVLHNEFILRRHDRK